MMQIKIIVISKLKFWTLGEVRISILITFVCLFVFFRAVTAFLRHMGYLGFILLLTLFCYCTGLIITCKRKDTFKVVFPEKKNDVQRKIQHDRKKKIEEESDLTVCVGNEK